MSYETKFKNPWDSGWRAALIYSIIAVIVLSLIWLFGVGPKVEVCETYYKELSLRSCVFSRYGLPYKN